jgi:hypothetical protein
MIIVSLLLLLLFRHFLPCWTQAARRQRLRRQGGQTAAADVAFG